MSRSVILFSWWFLVWSNSYGFQYVTTVAGPFESQAQCKVVREWVNTTRSTGSTSECREVTK